MALMTKLLPLFISEMQGDRQEHLPREGMKKKKTLAEKKKQAYALLVVFDDCLMKSYLPGYDEMHVLQWQ